jgi:hypothetical protein
MDFPCKAATAFTRLRSLGSISRKYLDLSAVLVIETLLAINIVNIAYIFKNFIYIFKKYVTKYHYSQYSPICQVNSPLFKLNEKKM